MNPQQALEAAITELQHVIDAAPLTDERRSGPTPCSAFNVEQLCEHIIDTHNLLLAGAGGEPRTGAGSLSDRHAEIAAAAVTQWATRGTDGTIDLGGNELPAAFGLSLHTLESYIHAWDLARSLNRPFEPPTELTAAMWGFAQASLTDDVRGDTDRAPYLAAVDEPTDATDLDRIIALSGRNPRWRQD
jgi:uncharacterized protein (TIGR03086 family)